MVYDLTNGIKNLVFHHFCKKKNISQIIICGKTCHFFCIKTIRYELYWIDYEYARMRRRNTLCIESNKSFCIKCLRRVWLFCLRVYKGTVGLCGQELWRLGVCTCLDTRSSLLVLTIHAVVLLCKQITHQRKRYLHNS